MPLGQVLILTTRTLQRGKQHLWPEVKYILPFKGETQSAQ